jgi:hypothetical protein
MVKLKINAIFQLYTASPRSTTVSETHMEVSFNPHPPPRGSLPPCTKLPLSAGAGTPFPRRHSILRASPAPDAFPPSLHPLAASSSILLWRWRLRHAACCTSPPPAATPPGPPLPTPLGARTGTTTSGKGMVPRPPGTLLGTGSPASAPAPAQRCSPPPRWEPWLPQLQKQHVEPGRRTEQRRRRR